MTWRSYWSLEVSWWTHRANLDALSTTWAPASGSCQQLPCWEASSDGTLWSNKWNTVKLLHTSTIRFYNTRWQAELCPSWVTNSCSAGQEIYRLYETLRFIAMFTTALHWSLSYAKRIRSTPLHSDTLISIPILSPYTPRSSEVVSYFIFSNQLFL
jgi:hypothetical protein